MTEPMNAEELEHWSAIANSGSAAGEMAGHELRRMFATIDALVAENAWLRSALAPFSAACDGYETEANSRGVVVDWRVDHWARWGGLTRITIGHLRAARAALSETGE